MTVWTAISDLTPMKKNKSSVPPSLPRALQEPATRAPASTQDSPRTSERGPVHDKKPDSTPCSHRELGRAILAGCDPVELGRKLLESKSESVRERALELITGRAYGAPKPATNSDKAPGVRIVWDLLEPAEEEHSSADAPKDPDDIFAGSK